MCVRVCVYAHVWAGTCLCFPTVHPMMTTCSALCNAVLLWRGSAAHSHSHTHTHRDGNRFLWQVASLSKSFPIKEKKKCEVLVGLKVFSPWRKKKNSQNPLFFTFFSHFLMNKYYPLKTFKKVLRYTVLYFCFLYYSLVATTVLSLQPPQVLSALSHGTRRSPRGLYS